MDTISFQTQLQVKIPMENPLGNHDHEEDPQQPTQSRRSSVVCY